MRIYTLIELTERCEVGEWFSGIGINGLLEDVSSKRCENRKRQNFLIRLLNDSTKIMRDMGNGESHVFHGRDRFSATTIGDEARKAGTDYYPFVALLAKDY